MVKLINLTGIVIKKTDYKASNRLIQVFTKESGLITLGVRGINGKKTKLLALTSPLSAASFQIKTIRDNYYLADGTPFAHFEPARKNLKSLKIACEILKALEVTQMPENPAPLLFDLTLFCLNKLGPDQDANPLLALFLLKLLKHEGLLPLQGHALEQTAHLQLTKLEKTLMDNFLHKRSISSLNLEDFSESFLDKIRSLFLLLYPN